MPCPLSSLSQRGDEALRGYVTGSRSLKQHGLPVEFELKTPFFCFPRQAASDTPQEDRRKKKWDGNGVAEDGQTVKFTPMSHELSRQLGKLRPRKEQSPRKKKSTTRSPSDSSCLGAIGLCGPQFPDL